VRVLVNGVPQVRRVGIGLTSTAWTEITSGLNEGDTIIVAQAQSSNGQQRGPGFGPGGFGGPGGIRIQGGDGRRGG